MVPGQVEIALSYIEVENLINKLNEYYPVNGLP